MVLNFVLTGATMSAFGDVNCYAAYALIPALLWQSYALAVFTSMVRMNEQDGRGRGGGGGGSSAAGKEEGKSYAAAVTATVKPKTEKKEE